MTQQTLMPVVVMNMNMQLLRSAQWWQSSSAWAGCQLQLSRTTFKDSMTGNPSAPPAFVFDIDGVLVRGQKAIPSAVQAIKQLCRGGTWRYPVCFLTNGGGVLEACKAQQLSRWLDVPVQENQVVLSHTPMRALAARLAGQCVLVSGRHDVINVAASYGFRKLLSTAQLAAALPGALPFMGRAAVAPSTAAAGAVPEGPCPIRDLGWASEEQPIAAVLVMADPQGTHWYQDLQLLTDVITCHGVPGRQQPVPGSKPVEIYFSNPDLLWASDYPRPRFGQGAFSTALDALYRQLKGSPLPNARWFGKPNPEPYRVAEQLLMQQALQLGLLDPVTAAAVAGSTSANAGGDNVIQVHHDGRSGDSSSSTSSIDSSCSSHGARPAEHCATAAADQLLPSNTSAGQPCVQQLQQQVCAQAADVFSNIFAVGDNPAADIRGANNAGHPWVSVLVRTGVFQGEGNSEVDPAHIVVTDVLAAVQAGLHRARSSRWHSMR